MKAEFYFDHRRYICSLVQVDFVKELKIKNHQGLVLAVKQGQKMGLLGKNRQDARQVDVSKPPFYNLIKAAMSALDVESKNEVILDKNRALARAEDTIQQQGREIRILNEQMNMLVAQLELLSAQQQQLSVQLIENEIIESEISQEVDRPLPPQEIENSTAATEIDREIEQVPPEMPELSVQLMEDRSLEEEIEEEAEIGGVDDEIVASEIAEQAEYPVEVEVIREESEIKRLPKRASNRKMRKKS
jgi:hypothetical protein